MSEIDYLLKMNYLECVNALKEKYGFVQGDYFLTETCKSVNKKIKRGKEGLYIHHIDEDKGFMLSNSEFAKMYPFNYQKSDRLVYCNLLEHLLLHIKIFEYSKDKEEPYNLLGIGGICDFIVPELNDIYSGIQYKQAWKQKVVELVYPLKEDYFNCIQHLMRLNFSYPILKSFNATFGIWSNENNKSIYNDLKKLGVSK